MIKIQSSNINAVEYFPEKEQLDILFHSGEKYRYFEIPRGIYEMLLVAPSVGKFFDTYIKKAEYKFEKSVPKVSEDPVMKEFGDVIKLLEEKGLVNREQDESGNTRVVCNSKFLEMLKTLKVAE